MAESDLESVFWLLMQCYWPCLPSLRLFIARSCPQCYVSFVKSANTGECFICVECWGYCGYCGEWIWVPSLSGLFPCHIPWALLVSFCHLNQAMCIIQPPPPLPDSPGKVHYSWCVLITFPTPVGKNLDSDLKFSLISCLWCSTRHFSFKFSPLNLRE